MQKWEYLGIYIDSYKFRVFSPQGEYLSDEDYKSIDPKGHKSKNSNKLWDAEIGKKEFLLALLNKLGTEGWELIGNITPDSLTSYLLLKRPIE